MYSSDTERQKLLQSYFLALVTRLFVTRPHQLDPSERKNFGQLISDSGDVKITLKSLPLIINLVIIAQRVYEKT